MAGIRCFLCCHPQNPRQNSRYFEIQRNDGTMGSQWDSRGVKRSQGESRGVKGSQGESRGVKGSQGES